MLGVHEDVANVVMFGIPGRALDPFMTQQVEISLSGVVDALNVCYKLKWMVLALPGR